MVALYDAQEVAERYVSNRVRTEVDAAVNAAVSTAESEKARQIARNMLDDVIPYEKISSYTGLSTSDIEGLANLALA